MFVGLLAVGAALAEPVRVGPEIDFPPFADVDGQGRATGYSVELFDAVAKAAGLTPEYRVSDRDKAWNDLVEGRLQALPLVARTAEGMGLLEYTSPHTFGYDAFFVRKDHPPIESIRAARGHCILVMRSDAAHHALKARGFDRELMLAATLPDAMRQLAAGPCAAVLAPQVQGSQVVRQQGLGGLIQAGPALGEYRREFAFATRKGDTALRDRLEGGLQAVKASGEYQRIHDKWLADESQARFDWAILAAMALAAGGALLLLGLWSWTLYRGRRESRRALARFRAYFEQPLVGIAITSPDKGWLEVNDRFCALLGRTREELLGSTWADITHPDDLQSDVALFDRVVAGEIQGYSLEKRYLRPDGTALPCELSVSCVRDAKTGQVDYFIALVHDASEHKRAETRLRAGEQRLKLATEAAGVGTWDLDLATRALAWDASMFSIYGTDPANFAGAYDAWRQALHPDDRERALRRAEQSMTAGIAYDDEFRIVRPDGEVRHIKANATVLRGGDGAGHMIGANLDITPLRRALAAQGRYADMVNSVATPIALIDRDLRYVIDNPAHSALFGLAPGQVGGLAVAEVLGEERYAAAAAALHACLAGAEQRLADSIPLPDGSVRQFDVRLFPHRIDGRTDGVVAVLADVTSLMAVRQELELHKTHLEHLVAQRTDEVLASQARAGLILESTADGLIGVDNEDRITLVNPAALRLLGYRSDQLMGRGLHETVHYKWPDGTRYPLDACPLVAAVRRGVEYRSDDETLWCADGSPLRVATALHPIFKDGEVVGGVVSISDVSARKRAEAALRESEARFREVADAAPALIWMSGQDKLCHYFNRAWLAFTGRTLEQEMGNGWAEGVHPEDFQRCLDIYIGSFDQRRAFSMEYRLRHRDGAYRWILDNGVPRFDGEGNFLGYIGACIDIEDIKQAEGAREEARLSAERLARIKSEFLANMSHEIRTPLNGVLGLAQIGLRESRNRLKAQETFSRILESGRLLLCVINDILDFSKIEAGKLVVESVSFSPRDVIADTVALISDRAEARGVGLGFRLDPSLPRDCQGDPTRLSQVLLNLLSNAVKFTERGEVTVEAGLAGGELRFVVADTGIGMSAEQLARLFTAFEQADASTTRRFGGTGLGLAISRRLVELMGGSITAASTPGAGTRFEVRLPYFPASQPLDRHPDAAPVPAFGQRLAGLRLLVAEDNEINRMVLEDMLAGEGASITLVGDGRVAVERVEQAPDGYDAVLMDVQMPVMDGREATRRIGKLAPDLPVIGQTAHALAEEHAECIEAGMVDTVTKPINLDTLVAALLRHAGSRLQAGAGTRQEARVAATAGALAPPAAGAPLLDYTRLLGVFGGRQEFVDRILRTALDAHATSADTLRRAAAAGDAATARRVAHDLKGVAGSLHADAPVASATELERVARAGGDLWPLAETLALQFEALLAEVRERLG